MSAKRKGDGCRVLLEKEQAKLVAELVTKLKADFCKVDISKLAEPDRSDLLSEVCGAGVWQHRRDIL